MREILLYGDIWYLDAYFFRDKMAAAEKAGEDVCLCINSDGGDVFEAAAMFAIIARYPHKVTCRIDGIAASAAAYVCMAADEVVMAPSSFMMIHLPWTLAVGNRDDLEAVRQDLMVVEEAMIEAHADKSGKSSEEIRALFEAETLMGARRAVEEGFADRVEGKEDDTPMNETEARKRALAGAERVVATLKKRLTTTIDPEELARQNIAAARKFNEEKARIAAGTADAGGAIPGLIENTGPQPIHIHVGDHIVASSAEAATPPAAEDPPEVEAASPPGEDPDHSPESAEIEEEPATEPALSFSETDNPEEMTMSGDLNALRAKRGKKAEAIHAAVFDNDGNVRTFDDKSRAAIAGMRKELAQIDADIELAEEAEKILAQNAVPVVEASAPARAHAQPKNDPSKVAQFGQYLQCFAKGKGIRSEMHRIAASRWGERSPIVSVLNTTNDAQVVPDEYANEIIELLHADSVIMQGAPRKVTLTKGKLTIPAGATGASAAYAGEGANIVASEPTFRQVVLDAKKLTSLVPITNEILHDSVANLETWVKDDIVSVMADTADINFLRADGSGNLPTGFLSLADATAIINANATVNLANVTVDLGKLELVLMGNNIKGGRQAWIMAPRTFIFLSDLRDGNGNLAFPTLTNGDRPMLRRKPVLISSQIPINLGAGTDESEIYLAAFDHVMVGEVEGLEIAMSEEASYFDGSALQSAFAQDLTLIRAITRHDIDIRQIFAVAVLDQVVWV